MDKRILPEALIARLDLAKDTSSVMLENPITDFDLSGVQDHINELTELITIMETYLR